MILFSFVFFKYKTMSNFSYKKGAVFKWNIKQFMLLNLFYFTCCGEWVGSSCSYSTVCGVMMV